MTLRPDHQLYHVHIWMCTAEGHVSLRSESEDSYIMVPCNNGAEWLNLVEVYTMNDRRPMNEREVRAAIAGDFLMIPGPKERTQARITDLANQLRAASDAYYNTGHPIMADANYDGLFTTYKALIRSNPGMKPERCPTDAVGAPPPQGEIEW